MSALIRSVAQQYGKNNWQKYGEMSERVTVRRFPTDRVALRGWRGLRFRLTRLSIDGQRAGHTSHKLTTAGGHEMCNSP